VILVLSETTASIFYPVPPQTAPADLQVKLLYAEDINAETVSRDVKLYIQ